MAALSSEEHALKMIVKLLTTLTKSLGEVEDGLNAIAPFYVGDLSAPVPPKNMRLEHIVNTHKNGIDKILVKLTKSLKSVPWCRYPKREMKKCRDAVESLFTALSDITATSQYFADGQLCDTDDAVASFCSFLMCDIADCAPSEIHPTIDLHLTRMRDHFNADRHLFHLLTRDMIAMRESHENATRAGDVRKTGRSGNTQPSKAPRSPRHRGPQTLFMKQQLNIFNRFMTNHKGSTENVYALAFQCWKKHSPKWDEARNATGHAKGYSSTKALANAWRYSLV